MIWNCIHYDYNDFILSHTYMYKVACIFQYTCMIGISLIDHGLNGISESFQPCFWKQLWEELQCMQKNAAVDSGKNVTSVWPWGEISIVGRADSRFALSQWETPLLCNDVSHWQGASLESALVGNSCVRCFRCRSLAIVQARIFTPIWVMVHFKKT